MYSDIYLKSTSYNTSFDIFWTYDGQKPRTGNTVGRNCRVYEYRPRHWQMEIYLDDKNKIV
jgi:hypothetical protein